MLVSVPLKALDPMVSMILSTISGKDVEQIEELQEGIYLCNHFNFSNCVSLKLQEYPDIPISNISCTGVCDSVEQFCADVASKLIELPNVYVASLVHVLKSEQPMNDGWRWHKWGKYIGTKNPQHEYLYDEGPEFEEVYVFHICEVI